MLYEMITGRRAFKGDSQVETMNAILKEDPPEFANINAALPASLDRIVRRWGERWGVRGIADPAGFPLIVLLFSTFFFLITPISHTATPGRPGHGKTLPM